MNTSFDRLAALVLVVAASLAGGELRGDETLTKAVDRLVAKAGIDADEPGVAIWIYEPERVNFRKAYGLADLNAQTPLTPQTMFELASASKPFTATAILMLVDRGRLSLDDDVRKYVPELPEYRGGPIRIRDLLHQTSGLPDYIEFEHPTAARNRTYYVNEDYLVEFARQHDEYPLTFVTGSRYEYSNSNYMLLGLIIARVSKKSYGTFLKDEIFTPLGMQHTFVYESPHAVPLPPPAGYQRAVGYDSDRKSTWRAGWGAPPARNEAELSVGDGGIWSNLEDMAAWDAAQRNGKLLKPETVTLSRKPSRTSDGKRNDYGLGWQLELEGGRLTGYGHNGSWEGFRTLYYRDLDSNRTFVLLSNRGNFDPEGFWDPLNDLIELME
jgi:CubicO group peptidase (beta-lactamase class C family)